MTAWPVAKDQIVKAIVVRYSLIVLGQLKKKGRINFKNHNL